MPKSTISTKPQHGGKRPGAGRKPKADKMKSYSIRLPEWMAEAFARIGGNVGAGVREVGEKQLGG